MVSCNVQDVQTPSRTFEMRAVVAAACVAFALKCLLVWLTYGTNDVTTFIQDLAAYSAHGAAALYRDGIRFKLPNGFTSPRQVFSHPPAMVHVLNGWAQLAAGTGLPLQFWIRYSCAVADLGSLVM